MNLETIRFSVVRIYHVLRYGAIVNCELAFDYAGMSRGFAFVIFEDAEAVHVGNSPILAERCIFSSENSRRLSLGPHDRGSNG